MLVLPVTAMSPVAESRSWPEGTSRTVALKTSLPSASLTGSVFPTVMEAPAISRLPPGVTEPPAVPPLPTMLTSPPAESAMAAAVYGTATSEGSAGSASCR